MDKSKFDYDGVIVFGSADWWVHNRGHYDMQFAKNFSQSVPVLYINSTGMRMPSLISGDGTLKRISRKLKSLFKGCVKFYDNFFVATPLAVPGKVGYFLTSWAVPIMIKIWARSIGIKKPLFWVASPMAYQWKALFGNSPVVYQRTDFYEHFPEVDFEQIKSFDLGLKKRSDLVLYCSHYIMNESIDTDYQSKCRFIDHGVDFEMFRSAGDSVKSLPELANIKRPIAGFIGALEADVVDAQLIIETAKSNPEITFLLVGKSTFDSRIFTLDNIVMTGQVDYPQVPAYMAYCDILLMPWNDNEWIKACNPIKLKEYLAIGRPIVSSYFPELDYYEELVFIPDSHKSFSELVREVSINGFPPSLNEKMRARVSSHTWTNKLDQAEKELSMLGYVKCSNNEKI
ncbi:glycosyltransferase [Enterovibrio calviensis]|uniref:glycosyltransferase n=1 Tax=Enterovibrio calviensis TaxID=91359 RepID=UPI00048159A7|nr:glycosyltransferase [Enterovibrio calviensis]